MLHLFWLRKQCTSSIRHCYYGVVGGQQLYLISTSFDLLFDLRVYANLDKFTYVY